MFDYSNKITPLDDKRTMYQYASSNCRNPSANSFTLQREMKNGKEKGNKTKNSKIGKRFNFI